MDKTAMIGILAVGLLILGSAACLTVNGPFPAADPTEDVGEIISAELTRVAPVASRDPSNIQSQDTTSPLAPEPIPVAPDVDATSAPLHSGPSISELVAMARPSLAQIITAEGTGSGFLYADDGYIVTTAHVVDCCEEVRVIVEKRHYDGFVVGKDVNADIAVVKIDSSGHFHPATFGSATQIQIGDEVIALGFR